MKRVLLGILSLIHIGSSVLFAQQWHETPEKVYLDGSEKVGIGTNSPSMPLHIKAETDIQLQLEGTNGKDSWMRFQPNTVGAKLWQIGANAEGFSIINKTDNTRHVLHINKQQGGRVGIFTTTPKTGFHVATDYYGKGHMFLHAAEGEGEDGTAYIQARDKDANGVTGGTESSIALQFRTQEEGGMVEAMRIRPDGRVGIGTKSPDAQLTVARGISIGKSILGGGDQKHTTHITTYTDNSPHESVRNLIPGSLDGTLIEGSSYGHVVLGIRGNDSDDGFHIISANNLNSENSEPNGENTKYNRHVASFLADGKVGIFTATPKTGFHVATDYYGKGHMFLYAEEGEGEDGTAYIQARDKDANGVTGGTGSSVALQFRTQEEGGMVEAMRIRPDGRVGIGTKSPDAQLTVTRGISIGKSILGGGDQKHTTHITTYTNNSPHENVRNLIPGSLDGTLIEGSSYGHVVLGIRGNDSDDGFHIISANNLNSENSEPNGENTKYNRHVASFLADGKVGIFTATPKTGFHVATDYYGKGHIFLYAEEGEGEDGTAYIQARDKAADGTSSSNASIALQFRTQDEGEFVNAMRILNGGQVAIGDNLRVVPAGYQLAVAGKIITEGVKCELRDGWNVPDYVFEDDYKLTSLEATESYINKNKHLPGIPSAKEIEEDGGFDLDIMNLKLLEKIEELTLHLIDQNKQIKKQSKQLESQNAKMGAQLEEIADMKKEIELLKAK